MSMTTITDPMEARSTMWTLIKDIKYAMFTTRHGNGHLHSRPMTTQNCSLDEDSNLWFFMSRRGDPIKDLTAEPMVSVTYADPGEESYVSVSGTASIVEDPQKKQQLWTRPAATWFPGGVTDPDLALVRVRIGHADYWDVKQSHIVRLYQRAMAAVTGKPPSDQGEHAEIRMS